MSLHPGSIPFGRDRIEQKKTATIKAAVSFNASLKVGLSPPIS